MCAGLRGDEEKANEAAAWASVGRERRGMRGISNADAPGASVMR
jgi:hypothetical protein